jgi:SOS-response transcriptional repressor LexA
MDYNFENQALAAEADITIQADFPNSASDKRLQNLDLHQLLLTHPSSTFLFRIRGEQGKAFGIFDKDIAVIDRIATPSDSDFVLWHDGRQFKLSRSSSISVGAVIWGAVTAVIHSYRRQPA